MLWKYTVYHELGHNVPEMRDAWEVLEEKQISAKSFFGSVLNILEDYRQERHKIDEYHGKRKVLSKGRKIFLQ
ncbi:MAG: hypothetical protein GWN86_27975, partial [Desulfobacterales bacterium]|nr:hypothetical protein [Desulfobacterales bacterium]